MAPSSQTYSFLTVNIAVQFQLHPALEALRVAYPEAEIVLLAKKWHANFLANRSGPINRVVVVKAPGRASKSHDLPRQTHPRRKRSRVDRQEHACSPFVVLTVIAIIVLLELALYLAYQHP